MFWNLLDQDKKTPTAHSQSAKINGKKCLRNDIFVHSCETENIKNVLLVIGSISELSLRRIQLINSCGKEITDLKGLLKLNSLRTVDMKINYSAISYFELQWC